MATKKTESRAARIFKNTDDSNIRQVFHNDWNDFIKQKLSTKALKTYEKTIYSKDNNPLRSLALEYYCSISGESKRQDIWGVPPGKRIGQVERFIKKIKNFQSAMQELETSRLWELFMRGQYEMVGKDIIFSSDMKIYDLLQKYCGIQKEIGTYQPPQALSELDKLKAYLKNLKKSLASKDHPAHTTIMRMTERRMIEIVYSRVADAIGNGKGRDSYTKEIVEAIYEYAHGHPPSKTADGRWSEAHELIKQLKRKGEIPQNN